MTLNLTRENRIYKKLFHLKLPQRDGAVLNVHHTNKNGQKIRFVHSCFNKNGQVLALADIECNIFLVDFDTSKFWNVPTTVKTCTIIKFSPFGGNELLIGSREGTVYITDPQSGLISGKLTGHTHPVSAISFAEDFLGLTSSTDEAMVWDMRNYVKLQVLHLEHSTSLKYVTFVPATTNILACFDDDLIQIWQFGTFEIKTLIPPVVWFNHELKSLTFTIDGKIMVLACRSPHLAVFLLSNYKLLKFITLPEHIQSIKRVKFIPQPHDGGANQVLGILSGRGSIHFYNMDLNIIISELIPSYEISKFNHSLQGSYISCILCSGDVIIYDINPYTMVPIKQKASRAKTLKKVQKMAKNRNEVGVVKEQIREILDIEKMRLILRDQGEYPDAYRTKIWERLLELPNNRDLYNAVIDSRMVISFKDLCQKYPLEDKRSLKNLKKLLDNLVTWCQFFLHLDYLPVFVFPFVKVFQNKPLACFEAVCTVIVNWCQFWFEYYPLPPVNVLAMVENLLMEHDPELLNFLMRHKVQSSLYAWPILKSVFSEVLTATSWKTFWDHVLTNEPAFFLCAVVSYNVLQRSLLLGLQHEAEFECFYNTHHPVEVKKLVSKTYHILNGTSDSLHPRQYLSMFRKLTLGEYPTFCAYPKTIVDLQDEQSGALQQEMDRLDLNEIDLFRQRLRSLERVQMVGVMEEERRRVLAMESAVKQQLVQEQEEVKKRHSRLAQLREKIREEDELLARVTSKKEQVSTTRPNSTNRVEDELLRHYSDLLRARLQQPSDDTSSGAFTQHQEELLSQISNLRSTTDKSRDNLTVVNLATGMAAMDALIRKIEVELEKERRGGVVHASIADKRVLQLQAETKSLVTEVNKLLQLLVEMRNAPESG